MNNEEGSVTFEVEDMVSGVRKKFRQDQKVLRTYPMREEWKQYAKDMDDLVKEIKDYLSAAIPRVKKLEALKNRFWSRVELDLGLFDRNLRLKDDLTEVEELES